MSIDNLSRAEDSARRIVERLQLKDAPQCALVLGSGWGAFTDGIRANATLDYAEVPFLGESRTPGHAGQLMITEFDGFSVMIFRGRRHWYEGAGWEPVLFPIRMAHAAEVTRVVLTNAAGGIREDLEPGALVLIEDHINMMGVNPLMDRDPGKPEIAFPDQSCVYDVELRNAAARAAAAEDITLRRGVYAAVSGPTYETPAEVRAIATLGADMVGMSTVPEAMWANALGMRVAGLSCVTNPAAGRTPAPLAHEDVMQAGENARPRMAALLRALIREIAERQP